MDEVWARILVTVVTIAVTTVAAFYQHLIRHVLAKYKLKEIEQEALQCLMDGIADVEDRLVGALKNKGKLTLEDIVKLREEAIKVALDASEGKAQDYLMKMSDARVNAWIKVLLPVVRGE